MQHVVQIKNGIMKLVIVTAKIIVRAKKIIAGILAHAFVRILSVFKSIADTSVIVCYEITKAIDRVSTNEMNTIPSSMTNTISKNVTSTVSINSENKIVRYEIWMIIFWTRSY